VRQAPQISKKQVKIVRQLLLFLLAAGVLVVSWLIIYSSRQEKDANPTISREIILNKVSSAAEFNDYRLVVEERGPGYSLRFRGQIIDGLIYGEIESYDLEIYGNQEQFFVKGSEVIDEWQEVEAAELDGLSFLVMDPFALLSILLSDKQVSAVAGPVRLVENIACQTYFLQIPSPKLQVLTHFEEDATLDKLQLYLWFAKDNLFMHRMALLLNLTVKGEKIQVYRIYNLRPGVKEMPEGLPSLSNNITANPSPQWISRKSFAAGEIKTDKSNQ
jgi:hypothetical protein